MSVNQHYNKIISFKPIDKPEDDKSFPLCYYTYQGWLTEIIEKFNHQTGETNSTIIKNSLTLEKNRTALHIAAFLNYPNIFLYFLTFGAETGELDQDHQSPWHMIGYRGHTRILGILLNHLRYEAKKACLKKVDDLKKTFHFGDLDIVKGKLSSAVYLNETNKKFFNLLQKHLRAETTKLLSGFVEKVGNYLNERDYNGQTPLHLAAMGKFSLSHEVINQILEFDFFKLDDSWNDYLALYAELQSLEIRKERMNQDPRRCLRLDRELINLLGDDIIKVDLSNEFRKLKKQKLREIINTKDNNDDTILHISSFHGNFKIITRLVYYGGNKKAQNKDDKMPVDLAKDNKVRRVLTDLNKAAKKSDSKNITELINFGEDINEKLSIFSFAPIHKAIESKEKNKYDVLKLMIEKGSDPNIKDSNGWTALHYASQKGDLEFVKILLNSGARIDAYSNNQRTALHLAAKMNKPEIVKYLLEKKSNPNSKDELGCTPAHLASKEGNTKCLEFLLSYGADLYAVDFREWNILHYASFNGHKDTIKYIAKYDADYDKLQRMKNSQNKLPIQILSNYSLKSCFVSLWHAAREGDLDMTRKLINDEENNIVNNPSQFESNTALHLAVLNNHYLEVRLLLEYGGKGNLVNKDKISPYEYATLIHNAVVKKYEDAKDLDRDTFDLREIVRNVLRKSEDILDATICEKNRKLRVWTANDFSGKIIKALGKANGKEEDKK